MTDDLKAAIDALLDQIARDENDGGLLSRDTHRKAGELRLAVARAAAPAKAICEGYWPKDQALSDCAHCGHTWRDHCGHILDAAIAQPSRED